MKHFTLNRMVALLLLAGTALLGQGVGIKAKAWLAQQLIESTWDARRPAEAPTKPWPWADTRVVARLSVPDLGIVQYVMGDASGESLAFGPGAVLSNGVSYGGLPGSDGASVIAGHRDTHFRFLERIAPGTRITVENWHGDRREYVVRRRVVLDTSEQAFTVDPDQTGLTLVTCWPFDAVVPNGPERFLVMAEPVVDPATDAFGEHVAALRDRGQI